MKKYEYKTILIQLETNGFWSSKVSSSATASTEARLNQLGEDGWQLTGVFPITNGGSPAQINQALHHFIREVV